MEIQEIVKIVLDCGLTTVIIGIIIYLSMKYLPRFIDLKLKRVEEKDLMMDSFKAVVENNSSVILNNSEVIKANADSINNYTKNAHKLEDKMQELTNAVNESNKTMTQMNANIEILKERR